MRIGVTISASIVPRSHSLATTRAVSKAPIRVMITATRPGTRKSRLRRAGLNQTRCSAATGSLSSIPRSAYQADSQVCQAPWI